MYEAWAAQHHYEASVSVLLLRSAILRCRWKTKKNEITQTSWESAHSITTFFYVYIWIYSFFGFLLFLVFLSLLLSCLLSHSVPSFDRLPRNDALCTPLPVRIHQTQNIHSQWTIFEAHGKCCSSCFSHDFRYAFRHVELQATSPLNFQPFTRIGSLLLNHSIFCNWRFCTMIRITSKTGCQV